MASTVLSVAFPFAPVAADAVGGAEQLLAQLDAALIAAGMRSLVIAAAGSHVRGELIPLPLPAAHDSAAADAARATLRDKIQRVLAATPVDVLHLHGLDFERYLPAHGPPALISLHLPLSWYAPRALRPHRPDTWLLPVSAAQARAAPRDVALLPPIENGVALDFPRLKRRRFALMLCRVCAEKGAHDALDACRAAGVPLLLGGRVFDWPAHRDYFARAVLPRLDRERRWIGAVGAARKRRLLAAARCVLVPSRAPETSSLVAMEALAAGTPVIAYRSGALPEIVEHGRTGFLVDDVAGMAQAIAQCGRIDADACRNAARTRFSLERMLAAYLALYGRLAAGAGGANGRPPLAGAA